MPRGGLSDIPAWQPGIEGPPGEGLAYPPEQAMSELSLAVLLQAAADLADPSPVVRADARRFLLGNGPLTAYARAAGINARWLRESVLRRLESE